MEAPYFTSIRPGTGTMGETIVIEGVNFGDTGSANQVDFLDGATVVPAAIASGSSGSIMAEVPALPGAWGAAWLIRVCSLTAGRCSDAAEVQAHNSAAVFRLAEPGALKREAVFAAVDLQAGATAFGFVGPARGRFRFSARAGEVIEAAMWFADELGSPILSGQPSAGLIAPDGSTVALHPLDSGTIVDGAGTDLFALPQTGEYTLIAGGTAGGATGSYRLSWQFQAPAPARLRDSCEDHADHEST